MEGMGNEPAFQPDVVFTAGKSDIFVIKTGSGGGFRHRMAGRVGDKPADTD